MKRITYTIIFVLLTAIAGVTTYLGVIIFGSYAIDDKELVTKESSVMVSEEGDPLTRLFTENRESVDIDDIPAHVQEAFIAVEDQRFYEHTGIDFRAVGRALYRDIAARGAAEGGSTITQQLAKNVFLSPEKSLLRKTEEALIAINLEHRYEKEEILEMYLNHIYFGHGAHGVEAASRLYFGKPVEEISIEEGALLAALPKGPNLYSPFIDEDRSMERRNLVLGLMEQQDYLNAEEAVRLQGRTLPQERHSVTSNEAYDAYVDPVLDEIEQRYGITEAEVLEGGYEITVPMNPAQQESMYAVLNEEEQYPAADMESGAVLLNNETGGVEAVYGGREYVRKGFHHALSPRQPGSVMKPLAVYAPALDGGQYHPYSLLEDERQNYDGYEPENINSIYDGEVSMYDAVKDSVNAPAVWLLNEISIDASKEMLTAQNIDLEEEGLGIALGGLDEGLTPLETAAAYRTFANNGRYSDPYFVTEIQDRHGERIGKAETEEIDVMDPQTAWYMTRMLEAAVEDGTGQAGAYEGALAGKTGTTNEARDVWFAGWTPEHSGAVWMGGSGGIEGVSSAAPTSAFKALLPEAASVSAFTQPDGVDDLEEPIRFVNIRDLEADMSMGLFGASVELDWSPAEDERLHYRIYRTDGGREELVDEIVGESTYTVDRMNHFSSPAFQVVPYNPQIDREGDPSNVVEPNWSLFSGG
ncbi:transglycosylase domain-containing protein [Alkalicoccus chagannorensis]|uniref:transglycosylase domain-containing protein n=1 Tax=Alkalicoccus chagannorensis TaxID=427072 RepID=UPI001FDF69EE|nr:PBP1A family penicillin-binding protein [Alkalicoccus chagannorensis]